MMMLRNGLAEDERARMDAAICERVRASGEFQHADIVLTYLSVGAEVDTRAIIRRAWEAGKTVAIPRCVGNRMMRWFMIDGFDGLDTSRFGVEEPPICEEREVHVGEQVARGSRVLALVPGLTFDALGYRLGYGGGYYDVFLDGFAGVSVGLCRRLQLVDDLAEYAAIAEHDHPVDIVVSD